MPRDGGERRLVWSSGPGVAHSDLREPGPRDAGTRQPEPPKPDGIVRVGRETKGRKGRGVSTISGLPLAPEALLELAAELKRRCGSGGTVRAGVIEIQGDHRDLLVAELEKRGFKIRRAG